MQDNKGLYNGETADDIFKIIGEITDEELLALFSEEIQKQKSKQSIGEKDIKDKFKNAMDEYIERTQEYL